MNLQDAINDLIKYLQSYPDDFYIHPEFLSDIKKLLAKTLKGKEKKFFSKMIPTLKNLKEFNRLIIQINGHEILKNCKDKKGNNLELYSLHINESQINIRFLVTFDDNSIPHLLVAFSEKSRNDYERFILIAINRNE